MYQVKPTLHYAAFTYLNEWMWRDQRFTACLGYEADGDTTETEGRECLVEVATAYGVIRNFKKTAGPRLAAAYKALRRVGLPTRDDRVETVENMMGELQREYSKNLLSAASKFLWMRFKSPKIGRAHV